MRPRRVLGSVPSARRQITPNAEREALFARTESGLYVPIEGADGVIHSRVLPGFRFSLSDLTAQPDDEAQRAPRQQPARPRPSRPGCGRALGDRDDK